LPAGLAFHSHLVGVAIPPAARARVIDSLVTTQFYQQRARRLIHPPDNRLPDRNSE
jgi:hypothetical protein